MQEGTLEPFGSNITLFVKSTSFITTLYLSIQIIILLLRLDKFESDMTAFLKINSVTLKIWFFSGDNFAS